jgi:pyruvate-formate lyase-activating enzyme
MDMDRKTQERLPDDPLEYVSCPYIEHGLVFALGNLCLCCITNHGKGYPRVADYQGGELPLDRILARRKLVRTRNQTPERYSRCAGCGYLEKRRWEPDPYPFRHLVIAHFTRCNLRCSYCYILKHGYLEKPYLPYDVVPVLKSMIRNRLLSPQGQASWGGGEPVLYDGFESAFRLLLDHGIYQDVNTNGSVLSPLLQEALRQRKASVTCGVDAGTAETYKRIKGRDCFDRVWRNLETYARTGGEVAAKIILTRENHQEAACFVDQARSAGVSRILYDVDFFELEQPEEVVRAIARLIKEGATRPGIRVGEGGGGIASFGEDLRTRISRSMDTTVTWNEFLQQHQRNEALRDVVKSLEERVEHLEQSKAIRLSRKIKEKHPRLMHAVLRSLSWLGKTWPAIR